MDAVRIMMENGVDVDAQDQGSGKTPLHLAVERNLEEMVSLLVREAQVDISRTDFTGVQLQQILPPQIPWGLDSLRLEEVLETPGGVDVVERAEDVLTDESTEPGWLEQTEFHVEFSAGELSFLQH